MMTPHESMVQLKGKSAGTQHLVSTSARDTGKVLKK
jgi:hypothetical protein